MLERLSAVRADETGVSPAEQRTPRDHCPACHALEPTRAFTCEDWLAHAATTTDQRRRFAVAIEADPGLRFDALLRCNACGSLFTDHAPSDAALGRFYEHYHGNPGYLAKIERKLAQEKRRIFLLKCLVRGRRFLDVGSNIGCAVEAARANGFAATGLELSGEAVAIARERYPDNRFILGTLAALAPEQMFDLVYCNEVIEHVPDIGGFVHRLAGSVAPGGLLLLTTPDCGHRRVRGDLLRWAGLKPPAHITLFTRAGVRAALEPYFARIVMLPNAKPGVQALAFKRRR